MEAWNPEIIKNKKNMAQSLSKKVHKAKHAVEILSEFLSEKLVAVEINSNNEVVVKTDDKRGFVWNLDDSNSLAKLVRDGEVETEETEFINSLIKTDWCAFDVGANFGWYTTSLAKNIGDKGRVYSFEPNPNTYKELERNCVLNNLENISLNNIALSNNEENMQLFFPTYLGDAYGSLEKNFPGENSTINCKTNKLDSYIIRNNIDKVDFLKIDVEGAELNVLKGAKNTIEKHKPIIAIEIHELLYKYFDYTIEDLFTFLRINNYKLFGIKYGKLFEMNEKNFNDFRLLFCFS